MKAGRLSLLTALAGLVSFPASATPLALHIHSEKAMFQVLISPGAVGSDDFVLQLMSGEGTLLTVKEAALALTLPGSDIGPIERKATPGADGYWHVEDVKIPAAGRWHLRIDAVTPFQKITLEDDFDVPANRLEALSRPRRSRGGLRFRPWSS